jgi:hypothetical protein
MSYSKRQLVLAALGEIGMSSSLFDLSADQIEEALGRLDAMVAEWNGRGVRLGYLIPGDPKGSVLGADSGIPDWAYDAVITNLAIRLAPSYGKAVSLETKATARQGWNTVLARSVAPVEMRLDALPAGAGNKGETFTETPEDEQVKRPEPSADFQ